jgi:Na+/melibiose symporter-like transporter
MPGEEARISMPTILAFGTGAMGEAVYLGIFNGFITIYYNQVIGLSNVLIGTAIMLALIGDAITDPLVGVMSDRWKSRHGRRHPFLFVAPVPMAVTLYFIFNPPEILLSGPEGPSQIALFVWLASLTILSRGLNTLYSIPHLALGGELTKDQHKRSQLFSANTVFGGAFGTLFGFITWSYFFAGERVRASDGQLVPGHLDAAAYGPLLLFGCSIIVIAIWACAAGTYKQIPNLSQADENSPRLSLLNLFEEILSTLKNANYVFLLVGYFFFMIASGIYDTMHVFINTYFWELVPDQIRWFGIIAAPLGIAGALSAPALMRRYDRKPVLLGSLAGVIVFAQLVINLRLLGWLPENHDSALLPILLANAAGFSLAIGIGSVAIYSMLGDIIDENELETGLRQEGLFYSARAFFAKASNSFGHFIAGVTLDVFVHLPFDAVPGQLEETVVTRMGVVAGPIMGVTAIISLLIYSRYNLTRKRHEEIITLLNEEAVVAPK